MTTETWFCPPDHLSYFNFETIPPALEKTGFEVQRLMTDFPIEIFLFNLHSNYVQDRSRGKEAHLARIRVDNFLVEQGLDTYVAMMSGAARCSFGRTVIAFARRL
jgi:hypothetical protein